MKKLNLYFSGQVRTLYSNLPGILQAIRKSNPNVKIHVYYSFWDSLYRELDRATGPRQAPDSYWAIRSNAILEPSMVSKERLGSLFLLHGCKSVLGILVDEKIMHKILEDSPFQDQNIMSTNGTGSWNETQLSPQYYQIQQAVQLHKPNPEEYCVRIRADIVIFHFPNLDYVGEDLIVNKFVWEGQVKTEDLCNEMIWISKGKYFPATCDLYSFQGDYTQYLFGEKITAKYFNNLQNSKKINNIKTFDFQYRVVR